MEWDDLPALFPELTRPEAWLPLLQAHSRLLENASEHTRVTSVEAGDAVRRHYAESLETWRIAVEALGRAPESVVDVGSGGGFPGLVMACLAPRTPFALVEPLRKRARLLVSMAEDLGLPNVTVLAERAEEAGRGPLRDSAELVTARAVAPLAELLEYTAPLSGPEGWLCLPKGSGWEPELSAAGPAMESLGCAFVAREPLRPGISETVSVLLFRKTGETPAVYPRRPGVPGKRPIA